MGAVALITHVPSALTATAAPRFVHVVPMSTWRMTVDPLGTRFAVPFMTKFVPTFTVFGSVTVMAGAIVGVVVGDGVGDVVGLGALTTRTNSMN